jgi:hypothetical protein
MNNTVAIVGIIVLVLYVAFRCVMFFGARLWKRSQQGHHDLAQEHFKELRAENQLRLVKLLLMELRASEQRGIALDYVMELTAYPDPESFEDIRKEVELRREARHLQAYGRPGRPRQGLMGRFHGSSRCSPPKQLTRPHFDNAFQFKSPTVDIIVSRPIQRA